jgi:DNA-binding transcriptional LysR family regulator
LNEAAIRFKEARKGQISSLQAAVLGRNLMNIVLARTFLEIIECGNLNKAADRLHVTQSTVTMRIKALETIIGQQLFIRNRSGAELTSAGAKFRRYAELLVQVWQQAQQEITLPKDFNATINIGIAPYLWVGLGAEWVLWLRRQLPDVALAVQAGEPSILLHGLSHGLLDIALEYDPQTRPGFMVEPLFEERLVLVSDRPRGPVKWHPLYVYVDWGSGFRKAHSIAFPDEQTPGVSLPPDCALSFIFAYGGSGYFPSRLVNCYIREEKLFKVHGAREFQRQVYVVYSEKAASVSWFGKALDGLRRLSIPYCVASEATEITVYRF